MIGASDYPAPAFADIIGPEFHAMSVVGYKRKSNETCRESAVTPTGDIRWPMSVVVLISSAIPPASDILDKAGNVSS